MSARDALIVRADVSAYPAVVPLNFPATAPGDFTPAFKGDRCIVDLIEQSDGARFAALALRRAGSAIYMPYDAAGLRELAAAALAAASLLDDGAGLQ